MINRFFNRFFKGKDLDDFIAYGERTGIFTEYFKEPMTPKAFWSLLKPETEAVATMALKLTSIPASNSQIERIFHSWSTIHTSSRNRLTSERSKKLVHCYYSLHNRLEKQKEREAPLEVTNVCRETVEDLDSSSEDEEELLGTDISDEEIDELFEQVNKRSKNNVSP